jgi:putative polyketide hydroxylase
MPHAWIHPDDRTVSTLDLTGKDFVLFTGLPNIAWKEAAATVSRRHGPCIVVYGIGKEDDPPPGLQPKGAVLVRPDGFVAWRCSHEPADPATELDNIMAQLLSGVL